MRTPTHFLGLVASLALAFRLAVAQPAPAPAAAPDRFIVLSEFQVWADAASPEVFKELSRLYNAKGRSHIFGLYPRYDLFVWDAARMRHWVDEAKALGCFNLFCLGDDTRTAQGHLFDNRGVNPTLKDFLFETVAYAHQQGFLVAVEPTMKQSGSAAAGRGDQGFPFGTQSEDESRA